MKAVDKVIWFDSRKLSPKYIKVKDVEDRAQNDQ